MIINQKAPYEIEPVMAYEMLAKQGNAYLIDVRTAPEWQLVGTPKLDHLHKAVIQLSWRNFPEMSLNTEFIGQLLAAVPDMDAALLFLCRAGGRSHEAAVAAMNAGYNNCYNIKYGFEGYHNQHGHRGNINGWKASNLPWEQQ